MRIIFLLFFSLSLIFASSISELKNALSKAYQNNFANLHISSLELKASSLPQDFDNYTFLRLDNASFNKASGYARAEFKSPQGIKRSFFFRYFIKAELEILRASTQIQRGEKLGSKFILSKIDFDKAPKDALTKSDHLDLIAKNNIKKNAILRANMFKDNLLVKKNDLLKGVLQEGDLRLTIELTALEGGELGSKIRVKNKDGKLMQGIISGKNEVLLQ